MVELQRRTTVLNEDSLLKFCNLLKSHQLLTESELVMLQSDTVLLAEKLTKLETVINCQLGHNHWSIDVILNHNEAKLLEAWINKSPLVLVRRELRKNYTAMGNQPDKDNGWLWGELVYPLGYMNVVKIDSRKKDAQQFSVEEVNNLATITKWRTLILGASGIGKTSFVWKLTMEWAKERILGYFLAIFYININKNGRFAETIDALLGDTKHLQSKIHASRKILFILDGWDDKSGSRWDLVVSSKFPQASVMITAQTTFLPWLSTLKWDYVYKVKGMLGYYQISGQVKHYEILTDKEVRSLLSHPLVEDIVMKFLQEKANPKYLAKLVHEIIRGITRRYLLFHNKSVNSLTVEFPDCLNNDSFRKLCKMAFYNMSGGCSIRVNAVERCSTDTFGLADILNTVAGSTLYTFHHKATQSFLAAIFMTQLNKEVLKLYYDNENFRFAWYFYGYLTSEKHDAFVVQHYTSSVPFYLLGAVNNPSVAINDVLSSTDIKFVDKKVSSACLYSIGEMIACSNVKWSLTFVRCDIHPNALEVFQGSLQCAAENASISKLVIQDINTSTHVLLELAKTQPILEELVVQHKQSSSTFFSFRRNDTFSSIISQQQANLKVLSLVNVSLGLDGAQQIANGLQADTGQSTRALKKITLKKNKLGPKGTKALVNSLQVCTLLTELSISYNDASDSGADAIAEYIASNQALETLVVIDNTISVKGSQVIVEALKQNMTVTDVTLHQNHKGSLSCKGSAEWTIHEARRLRHNKGCKDIQLHYNE